MCRQHDVLRSLTDTIEEAGRLLVQLLKNRLPKSSVE